MDPSLCKSAHALLLVVAIVDPPPVFGQSDPIQDSPPPPTAAPPATKDDLAASTDNTKHWGLRVSFSPWASDNGFVRRVFSEFADVDLAGSDFEIGVVRGSHSGKEWGVSYVRRRVADDSTVQVRRGDVNVQFIDRTLTGSQYDDYSLRSSNMQGVQLHQFIPFATIKRRMQFGVLWGVGAARFTSGDVRRTELRQELDSRDPNNPILVPTSRTRDLSVGEFVEEEIGMEWIPLLRVEFAATVLAAPGSTLRIGFGVSTPGFRNISVSFRQLLGVQKGR